LSAACQGKLQVLFVAGDAARWGIVAADQAVELHAAPASGDEDLLNVAAVHTLLGGGEVFALPTAQIPGAAGQAGIAWLPLAKHAK
jgi:hypothetical protein